MQASAPRLAIPHNGAIALESLSGARPNEAMTHRCCSMRPSLGLRRRPQGRRTPTGTTGNGMPLTYLALCQMEKLEVTMVRGQQSATNVEACQGRE